MSKALKSFLKTLLILWIIDCWILAGEALTIGIWPKVENGQYYLGVQSGGGGRGGTHNPTPSNGGIGIIWKIPIGSDSEQNNSDNNTQSAARTQKQTITYHRVSKLLYDWIWLQGQSVIYVCPFAALAGFLLHNFGSDKSKNQN
jgi:hypothetical protein